MSPFDRGLVLLVFTALTVSAVQSDENGMYLSDICKHSSLKLTCVTYEDVDRHLAGNKVHCRKKVEFGL